MRWVPILAAVIEPAGATLEQSRSALAAILLFALVLVVVLTAVTLLMLSLHRRKQRQVPRSTAPDPVDAWREAGRRAQPPGEDSPSREDDA